MLALALTLLPALAAAPARADLPLADFGAGFDPGRVEARSVALSLTRAGNAPALLIESRHDQNWPGITLKPAGLKPAWDLTRYAAVALDVANVGTAAVDIGLRVDNDGANGSAHCVQEVFSIPPGARQTVQVPLTRAFPPSFGLFGMNGYPGVGAYASGGKVVDPAKMIALLVFASYPREDHRFTIANPRATGDVPALPDAARFFPFIDEFGQYVHKDWPGKIGSASDFAARTRAEEADLAAHPAPADRDRWGGWASGPTFKATGFFSVLKPSKTWWLVDPDGRLFWSQGVTCVGMGAAGPVEDRARWYHGLPREDDPAFKEFYWRGDARSDGRYKGKKVLYFDWGAANAKRKYGDGWREAGGDRAHRRLASWGLNTIGAWSSHEMFLKRRTPYAAIVHPGGPELKGSEGYWSNFRDVFDPAFRAAVREALAAQARDAAGDPWCLGLFVDNELSWGNETDLGRWTLASPAEQPARRALMAMLRERHPSSTVASEADLKAWTARTAEQYFAVCESEVRRFAPRQLYLGCRFAWVNDLAVAAAARHCDVVSYNLYRRSVGDFRLPQGLDKPVIIGEFHAGALDRGLFHTGLQAVATQSERGEFYRAYVRSAVDNPVLVGCHWFQYGDEPTTGRFDGENYQIGLVDVCDTPYPETVAAMRDVAAELYRRRAGI